MSSNLVFDLLELSHSLHSLLLPSLRLFEFHSWILGWAERSHTDSSRRRITLENLGISNDYLRSARFVSGYYACTGPEWPCFYVVHGHRGTAGWCFPLGGWSVPLFVHRRRRSGKSSSLAILLDAFAERVITWVHNRYSSWYSMLGLPPLLTYIDEYSDHGIASRRAYPNPGLKTQR